MNIAIIIQLFLVVLAAPLLSGLIRKIKNNIRMRKGSPVLQPYFDLLKLFRKSEVVSENASWIFGVTPFIVLASAFAALLLIPVFHNGVSLNYAGDIFVLIFVLGLGRFFLALAGLDTGSAFGGMGSSREMFISSLVEPVALLSLFVVSLNYGTTGLASAIGFQAPRLSSLVAAIPLFIAVIAETSRLPVDNQETHLELTMVHEAMVLEYSGRSLAMIELASQIKQVIFFSLLANIVFPVNPGSYSGAGLFVIEFAFYLAKMALLAGFVALLEVSTAKMRLFRVVDFFAFALVLSVMALAIHCVGL